MFKRAFIMLKLILTMMRKEFDKQTEFFPLESFSSGIWFSRLLPVKLGGEEPKTFRNRRNVRDLKGKKIIFDAKNYSIYDGK